MTIWANCIVHNEENFIWFTLMSVVDFVDKILVWDTGSDDRTVEIIKEVKKIKGDKIIFKEAGKVNINQFTKMRQQMLEESDCDWLLVLDGDEIWWKDSVEKLRDTINKKGKEITGIVVPMIVPVGDIYHMQEEEAGRYNLLGKKGHYNLRAFSRKIPGLHTAFPYGTESYLNGYGELVQEMKNIIFLDAPYLHVTHLKRSNSKRIFEKYKYELGEQVSKNFRFPEVLYQKYPKTVSSPWSKISGFNLVIAKILTPFRKIKRRLI